MPEIGDKFKNPNKPKLTFSFVKEETRGDVTWWSFYDDRDLKHHAFYPDEVVPIEDYTNGSKKTSTKSTPYIESGREAQDVIIGGKKLTIL